MNDFIKYERVTACRLFISVFQKIVLLISITCTGDQKDYGEPDLVVNESHVLGLAAEEQSSDHVIDTEDGGETMISQSDNTSSDPRGSARGGAMKEAPVSYTTSAPHSFTASADEQLLTSTGQDDSGNEAEEVEHIDN